MSRKRKPVDLFLAGLLSTITGYAASLITDAVFEGIFKMQVSGVQSIVSSLIYSVFSLLFVCIYLIIVLTAIGDEIREVRYGLFYVLGALLGCWVLAQADWRQWIDFVLVLVSYGAYLSHEWGYI